MNLLVTMLNIPLIATRLSFGLSVEMLANVIGVHYIRTITDLYPPEYLSYQSLSFSLGFRARNIS